MLLTRISQIIICMLYLCLFVATSVITHLFFKSPVQKHDESKIKRVDYSQFNTPECKFLMCRWSLHCSLYADAFSLHCSLYADAFSLHCSLYADAFSLHCSLYAEAFSLHCS